VSQTVKFDFSETRVMLDAISKATAVTPAATMAVVVKGALNIRDDARRRVSGLRHAPQYPRSITVDTYVSLSGPSAVIGPDKAKPQGALGNILEYGTTKNAPIPHLAPAAEAEAPRFEAALETLAVKALGPGFS
jgi:hypothetical protein